MNRRCKRTGKRAYASELETKIALVKIQGYMNRHGKDQEDWSAQKRSYVCPFCRNWHLTKQSKRENTNA